jgi:hypothetical protein
MTKLQNISHLWSYWIRICFFFFLFSWNFWNMKSLGWSRTSSWKRNVVKIDVHVLVSSQKPLRNRSSELVSCQARWQFKNDKYHTTQKLTSKKYMKEIKMFTTSTYRKSIFAGTNDVRLYPVRLLKLRSLHCTK